MKALINDNFLLENNTALNLYNEYAKDLPIVDYHCHIESKEIAEDINYENITKLWLGGDHYKWRLMRTAGIDERFITGDASDKEKFMMWAKAVESAFGNPLYHWTCLELTRYFGIEEPLTVLNAENVWNKANEMLASGELSAKKIMQKSNVELICTTDDPVDSLVYHEQIKDSGFGSKVLPAFRPDNIVDIEKDSFNSYVAKLEAASGIKITSMDDLKKALISRLDHFEAHGCKLSDHGTEYIWYGKNLSVTSADVLAKKLSSPDCTLSNEELTAYKTDLMLFFAREYAKRGWTMQLHFGCKRNVNSVMLNKAGINCGCDIITGSFDFVTPILSARKNTGTICLIRVNVIPLSSKKSNDNPSKYSIRTYTANAGALMNTVDQKAVLKLKRFSLKDLSMKNMHITMTDKDKRPAQMSSR